MVKVVATIHAKIGWGKEAAYFRIKGIKDN